MKNKKVLTSLAAVAMSAVFALSLSACGEDKDPKETNGPDSGTHTHSYVWGRYITEPTCEGKGEQEGICPDDDATTTRSVDALGHHWGGWKITALPTQNTAGSAENVCVNDKETRNHVQTVVLPALSEGENAYAIVTALGSDKSTYTLKANTDISFEVTQSGEAVNPEEPEDPDAPVAKVSQAVAASTTAEKAAHVRSGSGDMGMAYTGSSVATRNPISYAFGDNFCYVNDASQKETRYYSVVKNANDVDEIFAVKVYNGDVSIDNSASLENMKGFEFYLTYATQSDRYYGVEALVGEMYTWGHVTGMLGFWEKADLVAEEDASEDDSDVTSAETSDESRDMDKYVFSFGFAFRNVTYDNKLSVITVEFTLFENNVIEEAHVLAKTYDNGTYTVNETEGSYRIPDESVAHYEDHINVVQVLKTEDDEVMENPYSKDKCLISSITVYSDSAKTKEVDISEPLALEMDTATYYYVSTNPEAVNTNLDKLSVYYYNEVTEKWALCEYFGTTVISTYFNSQLLLRCAVKGEHRVELRTAELTIPLTLNVKAATPATFAPAVYNYTAATDDYTKQDNVTKASVFAGKPLYFSDYVVTPSREETAFTAKLTGANANNATLTATTLNGEEVYSFVATVPGVYSVVLTSAASSAKTATLTVTVNAVPDMTEILTGEYVNKKEGFTVTFSEEVANEVSVTNDKGTDVLTYVFANGELTTAHKSGASLGVSLSFNVLYDLVLEYYDGFETQTYPLTAVPKAGSVSVADTVWQGQAWSVMFNEDGKTGKVYSNSYPDASYVDFTYTLTPDLDDATKWYVSFTKTASGGVGDTVFDASAASGASFVTFKNGEANSIYIVFTKDGGGAVTIKQPITSLEGTKWVNGSRYVEFYTDGTCKILFSDSWYSVCSYTVAQEANGQRKITFSNHQYSNSMASYAIGSDTNTKSYATVNNDEFVSVTIYFVGGTGEVVFKPAD